MYVTLELPHKLQVGDNSQFPIGFNKFTVNDISGKATQNIPDMCNESFWSSSESADGSSTSPLAALGINNNFANHPLLAVLENRISSFLTYSHTYRSAIDVDSLAEAGYFYQGICISIKTFLDSK